MPKPNKKSSSWYPPYNYFICPECDENKEMKRDEFVEHLKKVHGVDKPKGNRSLMLHINRKPRHSASYKWTIADKIYYEYYG